MHSDDERLRSVESAISPDRMTGHHDLMTLEYRIDRRDCDLRHIAISRHGIGWAPCDAMEMPLNRNVCAAGGHFSQYHYPTLRYLNEAESHEH
jgi:hypothetical protein